MQAILHHTAIALSNGPFKNPRGSSEWIVEGETEMGCMKGGNMVPGSITTTLPIKVWTSGTLGPHTNIIISWKAALLLVVIDCLH